MTRNCVGALGALAFVITAGCTGEQPLAPDVGLDAGPGRDGAPESGMLLLDVPSPIDGGSTTDVRVVTDDVGTELDAPVDDAGVVIDAADPTDDGPGPDAPPCTVAACDDANPCTDDTCDSTGTCAYAPRVGACDDGDPCTTADACVGSICVGVPLACDVAPSPTCSGTDVRTFTAPGTCSAGVCGSFPASDVPCDPIPGGVGDCVAASCVVASCNVGLDDCDAAVANGCEQDLVRAERHCGACSAACTAIESCVAMTCGPGGVLESVRTFGTSTLDLGIAIAIDPAGGVVLGGITRGAIDAGGGALPFAGSQGGFLASYAADGTHRWSRVLRSVEVEDIAVDAAGNVYVAGDFQNTIDLGGGPLVSAGAVDAVVASFAPGGAHRWSRRYGAPGFQSAVGIDVAPTGTVWVTGGFSDTVDFGAGPRVAASNDAFVLVLDTSGVPLGSATYGGTGADTGTDVELEPDGDAVVAFEIGTAVDFGGGLVPPSGPTSARRIAIVGFTSALSHRWSTPIGGRGYNQARSLALDDAGNAYVVGSTDPDLIAGNDSVLVASFDATGALRWSQSYGLADPLDALGVAVARDVYVVGYVRGTVDFGGGVLGGPGYVGTFAMSLTRAGVHRWSHAVAGTGGYLEVAADGVTDVYVAGYLDGTMDFGDGVPRTSVGSSDVALVTYSD